jgi:hypothetical protein
MANPVRLNPELIAAAERASLVQKRSVPKQIEFWATIGKAIENVIDYADIFAILQGLKKITIEPVSPVAAEPDDVFAALEARRADGGLAREVTEAGIYYEASRSHAGMLDRVDAQTGERATGRFHNGEFEALQG